ncbi:MAG: hypothetical protein KGM24_03305 [Elusimicrobia bacterium]|nr:hypothetical protein [Elusimicrobiota bacterium]
MKRILLVSLLAAAVPASAQVVSLDGAAASAQAAAARSRALASRLAPARVDATLVRTVSGRLMTDGEQIETREGVQDVYSRYGVVDGPNRIKNLRVGVVEQPDPADLGDGSGRPQARDLVMRRIFSSLEARSEEWTLKGDGSGRVDVWTWTVSLDGWLIAVRHDIVLVGRRDDGTYGPLPQQAWGYRLPPSDRYVRVRWNRLAQQLLTMGRVTRV